MFCHAPPWRIRFQWKFLLIHQESCRLWKIIHRFQGAIFTVLCKFPVQNGRLIGIYALMYYFTVRVKKVASAPETFTQATKIFVAVLSVLYPDIFTNFGRFILIWCQFFSRSTYLLFLPSFEFYQAKLAWLYRQWRVAPNSPDLKQLDYQVWGNAGVWPCFKKNIHSYYWL